MIPLMLNLVRRLICFSMLKFSLYVIIHGISILSCLDVNLMQLLNVYTHVCVYSVYIYLYTHIRIYIYIRERWSVAYSGFWNRGHINRFLLQAKKYYCGILCTLTSSLWLYYLPAIPEKLSQQFFTNGPRIGGSGSLMFPRVAMLMQLDTITCTCQLPLIHLRGLRNVTSPPSRAPHDKELWAT